MSEETIDQKKERVRRVIEILKKEYPDARCTLDFKSAHQLLVAAVLAAQCTDERVNMVTPALFEKYPNVRSFAEADPAELEDMVRSTGFFRNKTKAIIESAQQIMSEYGGDLPDTVEELITLTGVGRKTANLIVGDVFGKPAVVVDTHVKRVSNRLGFTKHRDPDKIETDLREILPEGDSTSFNHLLVAHGRVICKAPTPKCEICPLLDLCPYGQERMGGLAS